MNKLQLLRNVITLFAVFFMSGCVSTSPTTNTLNEKTQLKSNQGVVVARVINTTGDDIQIEEIIIKPQNAPNSDSEKFPHLIASDNANTTTSSIFASPVDSGQYKIYLIGTDYYAGNGNYGNHTRADDKFGVFEVKPGEVTDLGTIIFYRKSLADKKMSHLLRVPHHPGDSPLATYFPFYQYDHTKVNTWQIDDQQQARDDLYAKVAEKTTGFHRHYLAPDQSLYFIGMLGVIHKRTKRGEWSIDRVPTRLDLYTISQNPQGDLVIGGDEGRLFYQFAGSGTWQDISLPRNHFVSQVSFRPDGMLQVIAFTNQKISVYSSAIGLNSQPNWQTLAAYSVDSGWLNAQGQQQSVSSKHKPLPRDPQINYTYTDTNSNGYQIYISISTEPQAFSNIRDFLAFSYDPVTWQVSEQADDNIVRERTAGNVKIATSTTDFWSGEGKLLIKLNETNQWREIAEFALSCPESRTKVADTCVDETAMMKVVSLDKQSFKFFRLPWFKNNLEGMAYVTFRHYDVWRRITTFKNEIVRTSDGGLSWQKTKLELPKPYCYDFITDLSDRLIVTCDGYSNNFYETTDLGESWQLIK